MLKKWINIIFIILFVAMLVIPLLFINLKPKVISESENRYLAEKAKLYNEDGQFNEKFISDFELWFNDNIGFRNEMVSFNANIQYKLFNKIGRSDMHLGKNNELNYATDSIIKDYQRFDLYNSKKIEEIVTSYQIISDYLENKGIQYYYMQCWDKQSIYPEYFSPYINQYGTESKTDFVIQELNKKTDVNVINIKDKLIESKKQYDVYSKWGDPTHWSQRGSYIGYLLLMDSINKNNDNKYKVLAEDDYNIKLCDQGEVLLGDIHEVDMLEDFKIKKPKAKKTNQKLTLHSEKESHRFYTNESVNNDTRVLLLADSYFGSFIVDDIAESFNETIIIWADYIDDIIEIIDEYQPDIVINESVERVDRFDLIIKTAKEIKSKGL